MEARNRQARLKDEEGGWLLPVVPGLGAQPGSRFPATSSAGGAGGAPGAAWPHRKYSPLGRTKTKKHLSCTMQSTG